VETLKDKVDFAVRFVYYSMHGKKELDENTVQYCIQKEQKAKYLPYLSCFLNSSNSSDCVAKAGVNTTLLSACINASDSAYNITANFNNQSSWLSGQYPIYAVDLADNQKYGVKGSPTLVVNGATVSAPRDSQSLLSAVCKAFNTEPSECNATLSNQAPSPGFGYTASGSASSASCG
jgi:hypothetical protein